ncbi:MAG TPA: hypothetical protein DCP31_30435 [Cyanobacteria bacterium UBA8543]|nr:hypothetical protein [Cyanobacteria bacterium UBA8543]
MKNLSGLKEYWKPSVANSLGLGEAISLMGCFALSVAGGLCAIAFSSDYALAQNITLDGSLGPAGTLSGPDYVIPQAVGQTVNRNLFHSFGQFNLGTGERATFQSTADIRNILSRVTGGSPSLINGLIFTPSASVNLFLMNPSGIIFGPNASIDVGGVSRGSFIATTANAIQFGSRGAFVASTSQTDVSLLRVNPSAFLFNQIAARPITSQAPLEVYEGQSLLLVGGNVSLNGGKLLAPGGHVELGGVAGEGTIGLFVNGSDLRLSFPVGVQRADVSLDNGAEVNVRADGGGSIAINAQNLNMVRGSRLRGGIDEGLGFVGTQAGDITLDATGEITIGQQSNVANSVLWDATGNSGNISIKTGTLRLTDGAALATVVYGQGNAGKIVVQAENSVLLSGDRTFISSSVSEEGVGQGGEVNIQTGSLILTDNAQIGAVLAGRGNAGKIFIQASDFVSLAGRLTGILSNVGEEAVGRGGEINIQTGSLSITDGAALTASTFGQGDAGRITVKADESISLVNGQIQSTVQEGATGRGGEINIQGGLLSLSDGAFVDSSLLGQGSGGDINIQTRSLSLTEDAVLSAATFGQGDAGNISVRADDSISLTNSNIFTLVDTEAVGQGGDISIQANSLFLSAASFIASSTYGQGNSGNVRLHANDSILLTDLSSILTGVASTAVGDSGDISVETRLLSLSNGSQLFASTLGEGNSGNIEIYASDSVNLAGVDPNGFSSGLLTSSEQGAGGKGGEIRVTTGTLRVSDGAVLRAITESTFKGGSINVDANILEVTNGGQLLTTAFSSGDAGNITVNATDSVTLAGSDPTFFNRLSQFGQVDADGSASGLFARTEGAGAAGNVTINTSQLTVKDQAQVSASTSGGTGGSITVTANSFEATDGGQLRTTTAGNNNAGDITLRVLDDVTLAGAESGLFANTDPGSTGNGGSIFISSGSGVIRDDASVAVDSKGTGEGGNIQTQAGSLTLNNRASISAETASNTGGDITLQVQGLLLMRHGSRISTTAGTAQAGGDGGNIAIDARFIVGIPQENSDITANAYTGRGGNVNITTQGIYGLELRPRLTPLSDITASSEFGVNGTVQINTPDVDPSRGLTELPVEPVNVEVTQGCQTQGKQTSVAFFNTGRGGLAPNPYEPLSSSDIWEDVPPPTQRAENSTSAVRASGSPATPPDQLVEAQGWIINEKGQVTLVAEMPAPRSQSRCRLR